MSKNDCENNGSSDSYRSLTIQVSGVIINVSSSHPSDSFKILDKRMKILINDAEGLMDKISRKNDSGSELLYGGV